MHDLSMSVVMCTFNGAKYLEQQLQSLCAQTCQPDEVIIYDDCSSDDTISIIMGFDKKLNLKIFQQISNVGYIENFRDAICAASADILVYCDQDDIWHTKKLELIKAKFASNKEVAWVISDADLIDENGMHLPKRLWETRNFGALAQFMFKLKFLTFWILLRKNIMTGMVCAVRRKNVAQLITRQSVPHDMFYIPILALNGYKGDLIPTALVSYRQHSNQLFGAAYKTRKQYDKSDHEVFLRKRLNLYNVISSCCSANSLRARLNKKLLNLQIVLLQRRLYYFTNKNIKLINSVDLIFTYLNPINLLLFNPRSLFRELSFLLRSNDV